MADERSEPQAVPRRSWCRGALRVVLIGLRLVAAVAVRTAATLLAALRLYFRAHAFDHAASLSFFILLSVAPFLILFVSAVGYIAVLLGPESGGIAAILGEITDAVQHFAPTVAETQVRDVVHGLVERRGSFGLVGGVVMILGASMAFGALEHAMEDVFQAGRRRRFLASRAIFSTLVLASGFVLFLLHSAQTLADSMLMAWRGLTLDEWLRESAFLDSVLTYLPVPVGFLVTLYLPGIVRVPPLNGLAGAALFFVLWEAAREAFSYYATSVAAFGVLYGSLATPILLILWTFYAANILLLAMAFVAVLPGTGIKSLHQR